MWYKSVRIFSYKCYRFSSSTSVTLCGCSAKDSPAVRFPPAVTPLACLATEPANTLAKRTQVFQKEIAGYRVTCHVDNNLNPFQDCLNTMRYYCDPSTLTKGPLYVADCKAKVDQMTNGMNKYWQTWHKYCDSSSWQYSNSKILTSGISSCSAAIASLKANANYQVDGITVSVTDPLINSGTELLWGSSFLQ